ncbi:hypothetical protein BaRGS_00011356 [Batillaria attramentaria]|uniref:Uncharacterized protein n=1 Tax=Batillaria attramentaria TaxID=370345 RepID=A0ABD0LCK9_9CAEN
MLRAAEVQKYSHGRFFSSAAKPVKDKAVSIVRPLAGGGGGGEEGVRIRATRKASRWREHYLRGRIHVGVGATRLPKLKHGAFTPEVVLDHPERVTSLHEEFVHAGSDVVEAFTVADIRSFAAAARGLGVQYIGLCCGNSAFYMREVAEAYGRRPQSCNYSPDTSLSMAVGDTEKMSPQARKYQKHSMGRPPNP